MPKAMTVTLVPLERIESRILIVRGHKVILDADLAEFYGVPTKRLNEQVKRNPHRFPPDFMFRLTKEEFEEWRSQIATSNPAAKMGLRRPPYAFTEHGALMLASVLNSERAAQVSVFVVRAFMKLRQLLATHHELAGKLAELERAVIGHDQVIRQLVDAIRQLMAPPSDAERRRRIGFRSGEDES